MNHRWAARAVVVALHAALLAALWLHRPQGLANDSERRSATVRLIQPERRVPPLVDDINGITRPPRPAPVPLISPPAYTTEADMPAGITPPAAAPRAPGAAPAGEPPRTTLRLTLPPGYAASSAAARNPALSDPRSNTPRATLEDRIADATGGAGAWVEESTSENRLQSVGALGEYRTVMRRGNTCVEVFRSRIADNTAFNGNVAPLAMRMIGNPYPCKGPGR